MLRPLRLEGWSLRIVNPTRVRSRVISIRPSEVLDTVKYGCCTKLLISPAIGSALTGCQVIHHKPGETFTPHLHPISEVDIIVFKGEGKRLSLQA